MCMEHRAAAVYISCCLSLSKVHMCYDAEQHLHPLTENANKKENGPLVRKKTYNASLFGMQEGSHLRAKRLCDTQPAEN